MSFIETILGWLFSMVTFFDNLKPCCGNDPGTAHHRSLKRACVLTTLLPFAVLGLGYLAANLLDAFSALLRNPQAFDDLRSTLASGFLGFLGLSILVAGYNYRRLWRFERGDDNFV